MSGNYYNGFSPKERGAWKAPLRHLSTCCSVCGRGPGCSLVWHAEDYRTHDSSFTVCKRCHYAIHIRFRRPDYWRGYISRLDPAGWFQNLSVDPQSLLRPFDQTYPRKLP